MFSSGGAVPGALDGVGRRVVFVFSFDRDWQTPRPVRKLISCSF